MKPRTRNHGGAFYPTYAEMHGTKDREHGWWALGKVVAAMILGPILVAIPLVAIWLVWNWLA